MIKSIQIPSQLRRWTIFLVVGLVFYGCAHTETSMDSPVEPPEAFSKGGSAQVPDRWWKAFEDADLNRLVNRALKSNLDLKTSWERLHQARAVVDGESASRYPELTGSLEGERSRQNSTNTDTLRLGFTADYEVDLWGRLGSRLEAAKYRAEASRADYRAAAISLSAELARTWFQLQEAHLQRDLLEEQVETNEQLLEIIQEQFGIGQVGRADVLRQRNLVESTREQIHELDSRTQVLEHQLNVLLGNVPQEEIQYELTELPELPPLPDTGIPSELIRNRPDIQSAFHRLQAADRDLAASISNQYPRLTLTASASDSGEDVSDLYRDWVRTLSANLVGPLLDAGRRRSEVDRSRAVKQQRLYEYGQQVLSAFQDVEDALIREQTQQERIQSIQEQLDLTESTYEQVRDRYINGDGNYIDVLNALREEQQLRRNLVSARLALIEFRIALYRALAGGFSTPLESRHTN